MSVVRTLLYLIHILVAVGLFITAVAGLRSNRIPPGMWHCALAMLGTGILLLGVDSATEGDANNARALIKLLVIAVIVALIWVNRARAQVSPGLFPAVAGLTLFNATLALLWT